MDADLFLRQFGHLAQGEGGIKKLRDVILQLAVRGKLVEQDSADEPAEVLLKKIAVVRKNFSSDYKLNASKENQPVSASQMPHKLPYSWQWVRLSNIGIIVGGGTPSSGKPEHFCDNGIAWLTPADMYALKSKFVSHGRRDLTSTGLSNSSAQLMPKGSVLFSSRAPIGYVAIAANEVTTNQGFKSCVPFIGDTSEYIYCYLKSAVPYIESLASGTTFKEVSGKVVANILFPLPPLAEQKRIVAKVDELMALCDRLEAEQKMQRTLKIQTVQSTLHHLTTAENPGNFSTSLNILEHKFEKWFDNLTTLKHLRATILQLAVQGKLVPQNPTDEPASELFKRIETEKKQSTKQAKKKSEDSYNAASNNLKLTVPNGWELVTLGDLIKISSGDGLTSANMNKSGSIPVYGGNGITGMHDAANTFEATIVIGRVGYYCGSIHITAEKAWITDNAFRTDFSKKNIDLNFLYWLLKATNLQQNNAATAQPVISGAKVYSLQVFLPPLAEQKRIVTKVDELMTLCDQLEAHITHTGNLNAHLMDSLIHSMTNAALET